MLRIKERAQNTLFFKKVRKVSSLLTSISYNYTIHKGVLWEI